MLKNHFLQRVLGASALLAAFTVNAQTCGTASGQTGPGTGTASGQMGQAPAAGTLGASDQKMLKTMAINNMAEIEAARMAQGKTQNEQVKAFAQRMIDDHTKALEDVRQLAQAKGVALPTDVDSTNKRKAARMAALSGDAFDRAYMAQAGVADHKKNHALLEQAQTRAKDPDLKALAARTLPVVGEHLSAAQDVHKHTVQGSSGSKGQTGSSSGKQD